MAKDSQATLPALKGEQEDMEPQEPVRGRPGLGTHGCRLGWGQKYRPCAPGRLGKKSWSSGQRGVLCRGFSQKGIQHLHGQEPPADKRRGHPGCRPAPCPYLGETRETGLSFWGHISPPQLLPFLPCCCRRGFLSSPWFFQLLQWT